MKIQKIIEDKLNAAFTPGIIEVENESHTHNVPPNSESHFKVSVISDEFIDLMLIKRHRMVNKVLEEELKIIHALALHTMTFDEWFERAGKVADSPECHGGGKDH